MHYFDGLLIILASHAEIAGITVVIMLNVPGGCTERDNHLRYLLKSVGVNPIQNIENDIDYMESVTGSVVFSSG